MCKGKVILMRQFRHAIRKEQLCCPRGFGEVGISTIENAKKELYEELNATVVDEPVKLGSITADSGLSSGSVTVYLMKIKEYSNLGEEGIREIVEIDPNEISKKVKCGEIDDGYTLSAFALYDAYVSLEMNEN